MGDRRSVILDAFERLVARFGLEKTTMRDVADEIGVSVGSLYNEFDNRDEIVHDAIVRIQDWIIAAGRPEADGTLAAPDALRALILGHVRAVTAAAHRNRSLLEVGIGLSRVRSIRERARANRQRVKTSLVASVREVLLRGIAEGTLHVPEPGRTAARIVDAIAEYWFPALVMDQDPADVERDAADMVELLLAGLLVR
jgi:AcrR family transcriptional regulator